MVRPMQDVKVFGVQDRRATALAKRPWVVRHAIDGRQRSKSFRTRAEADRYRSLLVQSVTAGQRFDVATGEPASWQEPLGDVLVVEWARRWLNEQWIEWQPRTRTSAVEALSRLVVLAVRSEPSDPDGLRRYVKGALAPHSTRNEKFESWLTKHGLPLAELDSERVAGIERDLRLKLDGTPLAATTASRTKIVCRACILAAVGAGAMSGDLWPPRPKSRARRKVARKRRVDVRSLPGPATMIRAIDAMTSHQHGTDTYRMMTAVAYLAGLRPSEVVMLRVRSVKLPAHGWGRLEVTEADISYDEPGEPKTGPRPVPVPPELVVRLRQWVEDRDLKSSDQLLFRTRNDTCPRLSNWGRAWRRALAAIDHAPLRVYDCRHAAATTWLRAGVPLAEVARRLGHGIETLVSTYVGALEDEERVGNERIEAFMTAAMSSDETINQDDGNAA